MDGWIRIKTKLDTKDFDAQIDYIERQMEDIEYKLKQADMGFEVGDTAKLEAKYEKLGNQLENLTRKKDEFNKVDLKNVQTQIKSTGKEINSVIKKMGKWALGVFAIESAYGFVRQMISTLSGYNDQLATDIDYIKFALASTLLPIVQKIVQWVYKLLAYVNYIAKAWFGVNLFSDGSVENFNKMNSSSKGTLDNVKKIQKTISSFDEMDVLQSPNNDSDNTSSGIPTDIQDVEISNKAKKVLDKIGKSLKTIYDILKPIVGWALENPEVILGILGGAGLLTFLGKILGMAGVGTIAGTGLAGILGVLLAIASIGVITVSIVTIYKSMKEAQKTVETTNEMVRGFTQTNRELAEKISELAKKEELNNKQLVVSAQHFKIANDRALESAKAYAENRDSLNLLEEGIYRATGEYKGLNENILENINQSYDNLMAWGDLYEQGLLNDEQISDYKESMKQFIITFNNTGIATDDLTKKFNLNKNEAKELNDKYSTIRTQLKNVKNDTGETTDVFDRFKNVISKIDRNVNIKVNADTQNAKNAINNLFSKFGTTISTVFGANIKIPKLASGGIINLPGKGVPIGGAIGGEVSREGVIPLTDSQAMEELGSAIGRYIPINLTNNINLDGRMIARQQNKIQADRNFAMNR